MNIISRCFWILFNLLFGAFSASLLFLWIGCDMEMPAFITERIPEHLTGLRRIFRFPYIELAEVSSSIVGKLIFNSFLYAIFGFAHTFFAQESVQNFLGRWFFPKQTLRTVYCVIVTITTFILMGFWQHTGIQLWNWIPSTMNKQTEHILLALFYAIISGPGCD